MKQPTCARCARPVPDTAYTCRRCTRPVAEQLRQVPALVDELPAARWRQTRIGAGGTGDWSEPWDQRAIRVRWALLIVTFRKETLVAVQRHHKHGICNGPCAGTIDTIPIKEWLNS